MPKKNKPKPKPKPTVAAEKSGAPAPAASEDGSGAVSGSAASGMSFKIINAVGRGVAAISLPEALKERPEEVREYIRSFALCA